MIGIMIEKEIKFYWNNLFIQVYFNDNKTHPFYEVFG